MFLYFHTLCIYTHEQGNESVLHKRKAPTGYEEKSICKETYGNEGRGVLYYDATFLYTEDRAMMIENATIVHNEYKEEEREETRESSCR